MRGGGGGTRRGRRRTARRVALGAVLLVLVGVAFVIVGVNDRSSPTRAVEAYFADLRDGDAAAALAQGDVPQGARQYLTSAVLKEQQRLGPLRDVRIATTTKGDSAVAQVHYTLAFPGAAQQLTQTIGLHRKDGAWRLDRTALTAVIQPVDATTRKAGILGNPLPAGDVLLFPGAVPVAFGSPNLRLLPSAGYVPTSGDPTVNVTAEVVPDAIRAASQAVVRTLDTCYGGHVDAQTVTCPLPSLRYVPGSLRGTVTVSGTPSVGLDDSHPGSLDIAVDVSFTGRYRKLDFDNQPVKGTEPLAFSVQASAPVATPSKITWTAS